MKILCLHGLGSSGAIFEAQIANLRRELDPSIELAFVDGPFECQRGPGIPEYHTGPFFSFTTNYSPAHMAKAVEYLEKLIEEEGPFDGIFGFSQGAALTLSYLYSQQVAGKSMHIKFACLFSTAAPCSPDSSMGNAIISRLRCLEYDITDQASCTGEELSGEEQEFVSVLQQTIVDAARNGAPFPWLDSEIYRNGDVGTIPCLMLPSLLAKKIQIPTVHCWGSNDFRYMTKMAEVARSICDESLVKTVLHTGLHDVPKRGPEIAAVLRNIDWAMTRA
ncbi:hypothetical protein NX059_009198 [Plenodomus lindquistii]|nr:hypothetical protein NX059_009198 [Plenodomus lindquistii]